MPSRVESGIKIAVWQTRMPKKPATRVTGDAQARTRGGRNAGGPEPLAVRNAEGALRVTDPTEGGRGSKHGRRDPAMSPAPVVASLVRVAREPCAAEPTLRSRGGKKAMAVTSPNDAKWRPAARGAIRRGLDQKTVA